MKQILFRSFLPLLISIFLIAGCSRAPFIEPAIDGKQAAPSVPPAGDSKQKERTVISAPDTLRQKLSYPADELDFARVFSDTGPGGGPPVSEEPVLERKTPLAVMQTDTAPVAVPAKMVRVVLKKNVPQAVFYTLATVDICTKSLARPHACRGRIAIEKSRLVPDEIIIRAAGAASMRATLPCTLMAHNRNNYFEYDDVSYRGSVILTGASGQKFHVINLCEIEDYLRGVVPLEIGKREKGEIEAVKAQAIAARTYSYQRMIERRHEPWDMLSDVSDQVYGGVNAEHTMCDLAVGQTRDMVIAHGDSLIVAYYHSTCGGHTANIEDVWDKDALPYLKSVPDCDENGVDYCVISNYYSWEETWSIVQLTAVAEKYCRSAYPSKPHIIGQISGIKVQHRYACGRVGLCAVITSNGAYEYGGDKIRFLLRRNAAGDPILRSARFEVAGIDERNIRLQGSGYGHGVGMCQMGAIGRARAGQSCEQILKAYYTGIRLTRAVAAE